MEYEENQNYDKNEKVGKIMQKTRKSSRVHENYDNV